MPIEDLRLLQTDHLNVELYKEELAKHEEDVPLYVAPDSSSFVLLGVGALLIGVLIGLVFK